jgi:hypothetical protein
MNARGHNSFHRVAILLVLFVAVLVCVTSQPATPQGKSGADPRVMPPQSHPYGKSISEWGAEWWQWALSFPAESNPFNDQDGQFATQGQSGPVWFVVDEFGSLDPEHMITRTLTVPSGKALLFTNFAYIWVTLPWNANPDWQPGTPHLEEDFEWFYENEGWIRDLLTEGLGYVYDLSFEIDGRPVEDVARYRVQSTDVYTVWLPEENYFGLPGGGVCGPCIDESWWLMLKPLSVGQHTIHLYSAYQWPWDPVPYYTNVTYNITVVPAGKAK